MNDRGAKIRYFRILLLVLLLGVTLRAFVLDIVYVPTRSMESSLLPGDLLLIDKTGYAGRIARGSLDPGSSFLSGFIPGRLPSRGTIISFILPWDVHAPANTPVPKVIKRCIAVAGDTITLRDGVLFVNGVRLAGPNIEPGEFLPEGTGLRVPKQGDVLPLDSLSFLHRAGLLKREGHIVAMASDGKVSIDGRPSDNYTVEHDHIFVMGDNHGVSSDSRHWGFLRADQVLGEPVMVCWSRGDDGDVRWDRLGTLVR